MSLIALFGTIYGSHYTISVKFYLYLQYFQQKNFSFSKISESQTNTTFSKLGFGFNFSEINCFQTGPK